jgi:hypothetical protein
MRDEPQHILDSNQLEALYAVISNERMATYLVAAGHDEQRAARLYIWNALVGEAFHVPIQAVEVGLRNRINHALTAQYGDQWWNSQSYLDLIDAERIDDLNLVRSRIKRRKLALGTGQIVAGLSFGFWVGMLGKRYNPEIWSRHLQTSFPHFPKHRGRKSLAQEAGAIVTLRNRIWHHEPIIKRDISDDYRRVMQVLEWLCPVKHAWIKPHCKIPLIIRQKP